jgi:hypothetical protein
MFSKKNPTHKFSSTKINSKFSKKKKKRNSLALNLHEDRMSWVLFESFFRFGIFVKICVSSNDGFIVFFTKQQKFYSNFQVNKFKFEYFLLFFEQNCECEGENLN